MTTVKCAYCGNVQDTYARWIFTCKKCGKKQEIINALIDEETSKNKNLLVSEDKPFLDKKSFSPLTSLSVEEDNIEIEEDKTITEPKKEIFYCPKCNSEVEKYQDCKNCGTEIVWSEE